jgi:hypothetical protein
MMPKFGGQSADLTKFEVDNTQYFYTYRHCNDLLSSEAQEDSGFNFKTQNNYFVNKLSIL